MNDKITLIDGAMGTQIRARGYEVPSHHSSIWSAQALMDNPHIVKEIHKDYISAGAEIITTNNYAVTQNLLERENLGHRLEELTSLSIDIAKEAKKESGKNIKIAASLPPLDTSYRPDLVGDITSIEKKYMEIVDIVKDRVDLIIIETMSSSMEASGALSACAKADIEVWLGYTLQGIRKNILPSGENLIDAINKVKHFNISAYVINCSSANITTEAIKLLSNEIDKPFGGYANSVNVNQIIDGDDEVDNAEDLQVENQQLINAIDYSVIVKNWIDNGATIVGGCCGTSPEHIKKINDLIS
ncbi:MAG: homocysteine S-methyltransferase family protein, partial [Pseudomonadota bacterium]|nr:homocysteine S-methyltransferase family protein [Pseudomonadota bacterium]